MKSLGGMLLLVLMAIGCSGGSDNSHTCNSKADCLNGQTCNASHFCQLAVGCQSDSACPAGQTCDLTTGACQCSADAGCPLAQVCSAALTCEDPPACNFSADCPATFFCDTLSHHCIRDNSCAQDIHCPAGEVCQDGACQAGCLTDGDCALADFGANPPKLTPYACLNGLCVQNACHSAANCPALYYCGANDQCQSACSNSGFCSACDPNSGFFGGAPCGGGSSQCLSDPRNPTDCTDGGCRYFCGVDCSLGQPCPAGAECTDVTIVNPAGTGGPGEACAAGTTCPGPAGSPAIRCPAQEGGNLGTCPCYQDADCPSDVLGNPTHCDVMAGACYAGKQCAPGPQYNCQTNGCGEG